MTTDVLVVGHSSLDQSMTINEFHGGNATSLVEKRLGESWPGVGGVAYLAAAASATGSTSSVVSWVGPDSGGQTWIESLEDRGVDCDAVAICGTRTPISYLFYTAHQGTICIYDAGDCTVDGLTTAQREAVDKAAWCILAVGPVSASRQVLQGLANDTHLAWAVKHDTAAFPDDLIEEIFARASVVSFSEGEREFLSRGGRGPHERSRAGALVIETRGPHGVVCSRRQADGRVETSEISVQRATEADTTGAGDTFIGTLIGLLSQNGSQADRDFIELTEDVRIAAQAATDLIIARAATADGAPPTLAEKARR